MVLITMFIYEKHSINSTIDALELWTFLEVGAVLKIRTICHAHDQKKLAWSCKHLHLLCLPDLGNQPDTALLNEFKSALGNTFLLRTKDL